MGTESAFPINAILRRRTPKGDARDELVVTGGGDRLVVAPRNEFGVPFTLDAVDVKAEYDVEFPTVGNIPGASIAPHAGPTPEEQFASEAVSNPQPQVGRRGKGKSVKA